MIPRGIEKASAASHPTRVRGLKLCKLHISMHLKQSHPTRVRGLKLKCKGALLLQNLSHPTRVRGLKFLGNTKRVLVNRRTLHGCVD